MRMSYVHLHVPERPVLPGDTYTYVGRVYGSAVDLAGPQSPLRPAELRKVRSIEMSTADVRDRMQQRSQRGHSVAHSVVAVFDARSDEARRQTRDQRAYVCRRGSLVTPRYVHSPVAAAAMDGCTSSTLMRACSSTFSKRYGYREVVHTFSCMRDQYARVVIAIYTMKCIGCIRPICCRWNNLHMPRT